MHFLFLSNLWVYSAQCRQKVKLNNANVHSNIIVLHEREKDECYNYMGVQFSVGICICQHIISWVFSLVLAYVYVSIYNVILCAYICMFLYVYVFTKGCTFEPLSVCAGGKRGSVVCLCVEGLGCSPDVSWEVQWSMSSAENGKSKPPTS